MWIGNKLPIICFLILGICTSSCSSQLQEEPYRGVQSLDFPINRELPGLDRYYDANPTFAGVEVRPIIPQNQSSDAANNQGESDFINSLRAQSANSLCIETGDLAIEYSRFSAEQSGNASIERIIDTFVIDDLVEEFTPPTGEEKVAILICWARVEWSTGHESDVDLYLIIDSQEQLRVRWDNITNVKNP